MSVLTPDGSLCSPVHLFSRVLGLYDTFRSVVFIPWDRFVWSSSSAPPRDRSVAPNRLGTTVLTDVCDSGHSVCVSVRGDALSTTRTSPSNLSDRLSHDILTSIERPMNQDVLTLSSGVDSRLGLLFSAGRLSSFTSALLSAERGPLRAVLSGRMVRWRLDSRGDGVTSPGDTGDMTGALTGRVDLLSGVLAMARRREGDTGVNDVMLRPSENITTSEVTEGFCPGGAEKQGLATSVQAA